MESSFTTRDGLAVTSTRRPLDPGHALDGFAQRLDGARGGLFSSGVDYPGRYSRWAFGFADPPLEILGQGRDLTLRALNGRGEALVALLAPTLAAAPDTVPGARGPREAGFTIAEATRPFAEEERSRQPSLMSPLRHLIRQFAGLPDRFLGLYGAFGYDLLFRFEPMTLRHPRGAGARDIHLFLPDRLIVVDRRKEEAFAIDYEFTRGETTTFGRRREAFAPPAAAIRRPPAAPRIDSDLADADYAAMVDRARERIRVGDIFEVVLSRTFVAPYDGAPSQLYERMTRINPSPYEFLIQLGEEQLVGTSPEMFVRVEDRRVESCPISGTARRGADAMEDAARLKALINSEKDEVELTMCTDVDRNDKARVCQPGSVRLLARRQIETYAGLFHTVDHVEGRLRDGFDGIDAFLSHMWAVTLTGAPKRMAAGIVEAEETSARGWYGGAVGALLFNGDVNTGITIRTIHLRGGAARYRVGATIVWDSTGPEEERETRLKSTTLFRALAPDAPPAAAFAAAAARPGEGRSVVLIDNEDSFVHTLADYFRQTGAEVRTFRHGLSPQAIAALRPDLVVHSPGPARPADFGVPDLVRGLAALGLPQFGVCLGLQGIVEAFGGALDVLPEPRHGKTWTIAHDGQGLFAGLPLPMTVGAYHSLTARMAAFPHGELAVTAMNETGLVMAIRHRRLPLAAVQFHPESILSAAGGTGLGLIANAMRGLAAASRR